MKSSRKASLDLSVNSIVVMVIAFVVLGLILTFTRGIFTFGSSQLTRAIGAVDLSVKPTVDIPFTPTILELNAGGRTPVDIGIYNRGSNTYKSVKLKFTLCMRDDGLEYDPLKVTAPPLGDGAKPTLPLVNMLPIDKIETGKIGAVAVNIDAKSLVGGYQYVCNVAIHSTDTSINKQGSTPQNALKGDERNPYETLQIKVSVKS